MGKKNCIDVLESRMLLSAAPVLLANLSIGPTPGLAIDSQGNLFGTTPAYNASGGTVFEIPAGTRNINTLASFGPNDSTNTLGINPASILIDSTGDLFGSAQTTSSNTEVWELPAGSNTITVLNATLPPLTILDSIDAAGDVFGSGQAAVYSQSDDLAFVLTKSGSLQRLVDGTTDTTVPTFTSITCDTGGVAYLTYNSKTAPGQVEKILPGSTTQSLFFTSSDFTNETLDGIATDSTGDVYLTGSGDAPGSSVESGEILKVSAATGAATVLASFPLVTPAASVGSPVVDSAGDVFAMMSSGSVSAPIQSVVELPAGQKALQTIVSSDTGPTVHSILPGTGGKLFATTGSQVIELPTVGINPTITTSHLPATLIGGVKFTGIVRTLLQPLAGGAGVGVETTDLFAFNTYSGDVLLAKSSQRYRKGARQLVTTFHFSTSLQGGGYELIAQTTDATGNVVRSAVGAMVAVESAFTNVVPTLQFISPTVQAGGHGGIRLLLTNTGNVPWDGELFITLGIYATSAAGIANPTVILPLAFKVSPQLSGRRPMHVAVRFNVPATTPLSALDGTYTPVLTVIANGETTTATSPTRVTVVAQK